MMIKNAFNIILLSLSLTTLLITLISYIIFRLRYSLSQKHSDEKHHLEGMFFRRYAPHLKNENDHHREEIEEKLRRREKRKVKPVLVFIFVGAAIACLLTAENYFIFRKELNSKLKTAADYRLLIGKGLLKSYDFNPELPNPSTTEFISEAFSRKQMKLAARLKERRITLVSPTSSQSDPIHLKALREWKAFLSRYELGFKIVHDFSTLSSRDLVICPDIHIKSSQDASALEGLLKNGTQVVLTGGSDPRLLKDFFDLKAEENTESGQNYPTLFGSDERLLLDLPPGLLVQWYPIENNYRYLTSFENAVAFQSTFNGKGLSKDLPVAARWVVRQDRSSRRAWMALDPVEESNGKADPAHESRAFVDHAILGTLAWVAGLPLSKVSTWKEGYPAASVISIDSEDRFTNIKPLAKLIKESGHPVTTFVVSNLFLEHKTELETFDAMDEVGSHTDDHLPMSDFETEKNFARLQNSRLDIEENLKRPIRGFRPPEEIYDENTLNAVKQSGFHYLFADQRPFRFAPVFLDHGSLLLFPRLVDDDVLIKKNRLLETPSKVAEHMLNQYKTVRALGGAYFFSLHTHIFGEERFYLESFRTFLDAYKSENTWKTTFSEMSAWWKNRDALSTDVEEKLSASQVEVKLTVKNAGNQDVSGAVALVVPSIPLNGTETVSVLPEADRAPASVSRVERNRIRVALPVVGPNETVVLRIIVRR